MSVFGCTAFGSGMITSDEPCVCKMSFHLLYQLDSWEVIALMNGDTVFNCEVF